MLVVLLPALSILLAWIKVVWSSSALACCHPDEAWMLSATVASVLMLAVPLPLLSPLWGLICALAINVGVSLVALANTVHLRFFGDLISVTQIWTMWQLPSVSASIVAALRLKDAVYFLDLAAFLFVLPWYRREYRGFSLRERIERRRFSASIFSCAILFAAPGAKLVWTDPEGVFEYAIGKRQVVAAVGLLPYHMHDFGTHVLYSALGRITVGNEERRRVERFLAEFRREQSSFPSPLDGIAKGRNLVVVQAESLHSFPIGLKISGQEIMPRLSAFARESLYYDHFYDQTHMGCTADGEFTALQSLHPVNGGAVATRYHTNQYAALPAILGAAGYRTFAAIGASGEFWNMRAMHRQLGFQRSYFASSYREGERFGQGLADGEFFRQTLPLLMSEPEPFFAFLLTVSNHHPYNLPKHHRVLQLGDLEGTLVGEYLHSVRYFDEAFGRLIDGMKKAGLLDRTVLVVYGDHQAWLGNAPELARILEFPNNDPIHYWETRKKVPLIIRLPNGQKAGKPDVTGGHVDIAPTLLNLLGIAAGDRVMLGRDLNNSKGGLVVFRDGSFADGRHYFIASETDPVLRGCRDAKTFEVLDCGFLDNERKSARERLEISDFIIKGNLIPARDPSRIASSFWLSELSPPKAHSKELGLKHVNIRELDMDAHPPSGATFNIKGNGRSAEIFFTPSFNPGVPRGKSDGVTFQVWRNGKIIYDKHLTPNEAAPPVRLRIAEKHDPNPVALSLVTLPGPKNDATYDWAVWRDVRVQLAPLN